MDPEFYAQLWPVFSAESREQFQTLREGVLALERNPSDVERLGEVRRAVHNFKGNAASLDLADVERIARAVEGALFPFEPGRGPDRATVLAILEALDAMEGAIRRGDDGADTCVPEITDLLAALS